MYKYDKDKKAWENFFDTIEIEIDRILIENGYASPYELFQFDKETIYIIPTPPPFKPVKFVFEGDNGQSYTNCDK